jgi:hypothetical protein
VPGRKLALVGQKRGAEGLWAKNTENAAKPKSAMA